MYRRNILSLTIMALGLAMLPGSAMSQQRSMKEQISGAWTLVSVDQTSPDGKKEQLFGPNPKGVMILDPSGQYVLIISRPGREKFKANSRIKGTPEENTAAVLGTTASFGTWSVDSTGKTLTVRTEGGMYPNQDGTTSTRTVSLSGDDLRMINPSTASGMKSENVYKRAK